MLYGQTVEAHRAPLQPRHQKPGAVRRRKAGDLLKKQVLRRKRINFNPDELLNDDLGHKIDHQPECYIDEQAPTATQSLIIQKYLAGKSLWRRGLRGGGGGRVKERIRCPFLAHEKQATPGD